MAVHEILPALPHTQGRHIQLFNLSCCRSLGAGTVGSPPSAGVGQDQRKETGASF